MAYAQDLKSWGLKKPCGFESNHGHHRDGGGVSCFWARPQAEEAGEGDSVEENPMSGEAPDFKVEGNGSSGGA